MARISRKEAAMAIVSVVPEKIYRAAAYARLSVEDNNQPEDRESIAMQQYMLEKYIADQPDMVLHGIYSDNGESGTDFKRPAFERMMEEVRKREVDCIVVKDLSRFGRNYVETGYYLEKIFPYLGVRFVAIHDKYDTQRDKNGSDLVLSLKNLVNDLYAKDISQKVHAVIRTKQKKGEFIGACPPYGYLKSMEDKHKLVIDPDVADIVRDIFQWRLQGEGIGRIARRLNDRGVPSPAMYHYHRGHRKKRPDRTGVIWKGNVIRYITTNPVYAGHMAQRKAEQSVYDGIKHTMVSPENWIIVKNTHEALVSQEVFDQVQKIVAERRQKSCSLRGKYQTTENILKGMLICADCGTKMIRHKYVYPGGAVKYVFICRVYAENLGGQGCTFKYVKETEVKEIVFRVLQMQMDLVMDRKKKLEHLQGQGKFREQHRELSENIGKIQQKARRNAILRSSLFESYSNHMLTEAEYRSMKEAYDREAQEIEEERKWLEEENRKYMQKLSLQDEGSRLLKKYREERDITREMAEGLIRYIRVIGVNHIEITWNFRDEFTYLAAWAEGMMYDGNGCSLYAPFK